MSGLPTFWGNKTSQSAAGPSTYAPGGSRLALHGIKAGTQTTLAANCDWCRLFCYCKDCEAKTTVSFQLSGFVNANASWVWSTDYNEITGVSTPLYKEHIITGLSAINGTYNWSVTSNNTTRECNTSGSLSIVIGDVVSRARQQRRPSLFGAIAWSDWAEITWSVSLRISTIPNTLYLDFTPVCGSGVHSYDPVSHQIAGWVVGTAKCFGQRDDQCKVWPSIFSGGDAKYVAPLPIRRLLLSGCSPFNHPTASCYVNVSTLPVNVCNSPAYYSNPGFFWANTTGSFYGLYSGGTNDLYEVAARRLSKSVPQVCLLNRYCPDIRVDSNGEERVDSDGNTRVIS
jgi:hypothetical protein